MASKMLFHSLALSSFLTLASGSTVTCIQHGTPVACAPSNTWVASGPSTTSVDKDPGITPIFSIPGSGTPIISAVVTHTPAFPPPEPVFATNLTFDRYIALGDSYSAGIKSLSNGTLPACTEDESDLPCTGPECARNRGAYGYQYFEAHPPKGFEFLACSGADTESVIRKQLPARLSPSWVGGHTSTLTTLTIGGNNGDSFSRIIKDCVYLRHGDCEGALKNAKTMLRSIPESVGDVIDRVWAPGDRLSRSDTVILGYVRFWPRSGHQPAWKCQSTFDLFPDAGEKAEMNSIVDRMNTALRTIAERRGVLFVDPNAGFEGHRFCDEGEPWLMWDLVDLVSREHGVHLNGLDDLERTFPEEMEKAFHKGVFHPNLEGQVAYRKSLERVLDRPIRTANIGQ